MAETRTYNFFYDDNGYFNLELTEDDFYSIMQAIENGKPFATFSGGAVSLAKLRYMVEVKEVRPVENDAATPPEYGWDVFLHGKQAGEEDDVEDDGRPV